MRTQTRIELEVIREAVLPLLIWYRNAALGLGLVAGAAAFLYGVGRIATP